MTDDEKVVLEKIRRDLDDMRDRACSLTNRMWDFASKLAVPLSMIVGCALIRAEVVQQKHETRLDYVETSLSNMPPVWMKDSLTEIKTALISIDERIRLIETRR